MELIAVLSTLLILAVTAAGVLFVSRRRLNVRLAESRSEADRDLARIRQIDRMLLANLSLGYISQEIANVIPDEQNVVGGTIRQATADGMLTVLAISDKLSRTGGKGLGQLAHSSTASAVLDRSNSRIVQAMNQRQVITTEKLSDFEVPPLATEDADRIQHSLKIASVVAFPVMANERVLGVATFYLKVPYAALDDNERETLQAMTDGIAVAMVNANLLREVDTSNQRLTEANSSLRRADEAKDEFVGIASHQLRGPLTAIRGYLAMLLDKDFGAIAKRQQPVVEQISQSTNEVINILNDMLSVSRINAQRLELTRSAVKLDDLAREVTNEFESLAERKGISLELKTPEQPIGSLYLDALRMRQVLVNFVDNAIKYTQQGSVTVSLRRADDSVVVTVTDSGIGISEEDRHKMFTKFYRAGNARGLLASGTGLGLFVAKRIVEEHGGTVSLESTIGKGSTFGFKLPLKAVTPPQDVSERSAALAS